MKFLLITTTVLFAAAPVRADVAASDVHTIADFGASIFGVHGGIFRCIGGDPNVITDRLTESGSPAVGCWRVEIEPSAPSKGVGVLVPFFSETDDRSTHRIELTSKSELELRFIGALADRVLRLEFVTGDNPDAGGMTIGQVTASELQATHWRSLRFALPAALQGEHRGGYLRILAEGDGRAWFAIDRIDADDISITGSFEAPFSTPHKLRTALWVWRTREILPDPARRAALLAFCTRHDITDLFLQVPYTYADGKVTFEFADEQRLLNTAVHKQGMTMHALDGRPEYVLRKHHSRMEALLDALAAFNESTDQAGRYDAVHLDNEPYVMKDWQNDEKRGRIIDDYVALQQKLGAQAKRNNMKYGVDIPFWWDIKARDGRPRFAVETIDRETSLLEAIYPHMDNLGIMSYRERILGNDGVIAHCLDEFAMGERFGVGVFASVEIGVNENVQSRTTFGCYPITYFESQLDTLRRVLTTMPGCAGIAIHYYSEFEQWEQQS